MALQLPHDEIPAYLQNLTSYIYRLPLSPPAPRSQLPFSFPNMWNSFSSQGFLRLLFPQHGNLFLQFGCVAAQLKHSRGLQQDLSSITLLCFYSMHLSVSKIISFCFLVHCRLSLEYNLYYSNNYILRALFPASRTRSGRR